MNEKQFDRTIGLIGERNFSIIQQKCIAVIGLGGVGGTALESLVRTGFKNFLLIDCDVVDNSNLNRQILYTQKDIGQLKVESAKERIISINNDLTVNVEHLFVNESTIDVLNKYLIDFVVDAIDDVKGKIVIAQYCIEHKIPFLMSLGMANRFSSNSVEILPLNKTTVDPLAKKIRHDIKAKQLITKEIMTVFSKEIPVKCGNQLNSIMMVPSAAGLLIASYILDFFTK